ncbi:MAG: hypothetical protein JST30_06265 [Armatimonadetes bacterium]|nr:hypothetical protein [Armatimonadota bacterium]
MEPIVRIPPGAEVAVCSGLIAAGLLVLLPVVPSVARWIYGLRVSSAKSEGVPCEAPDPGTPLGYWNATTHWIRFSALFVAAGIAALFHDGRVQWGLIIGVSTAVWIGNMIRLGRLREAMAAARPHSEETESRS